MSAPLASLALLLALAPAARPAPDPGEVRAAFEAAAARLGAIDYGDVLWGRVGPAARPLATHRGVDAEVLGELLERDDPRDDVVALLAHDDPRVRGLALLELFDRDDPRLLPELVRLKDDAGAAVPRFAFDSAAIRVENGVARRVPPAPPPPEPRTVGQVARELVDAYLQAAGFAYGIDGYREEVGWEAYWSERATRETCASWLRVAQQRAWGGVSPMRDVAPARLRAVRARVDALASPERELVLLWLPDLEGAFATEAERVDAARSLGRERLLALLRGESPGDDPDLRPGAGTDEARYPLEDVARFVLRHAGALLEADDAPALLALDEASRATGDGVAWPARTTLWRLAAARLDRARAVELLESAWSSCQEHDWPEAALDRLEVLAAAWELRGEAADAWVAARFWAETRRAGYWPYGLAGLLDALTADGSAAGRRELAVLLRDPGFETCDVVLCTAIARRVDAWCEPDVIGEEDLRAAWHPLGLDRLVTAAGRERAAEQHPERTAAVLSLVAGWRERLRASVPRWEQGPR